MELSRRATMIGIATLAVGGGAAYWAGFGRDMPGNGQFFATDNVALRGADPVAYFTLQEARIGLPEHALTWQGAEWRFVSAEHRAAFESAPWQYAPQYGGYCAWAVAEKGQLYSTQPKNWSVVNGKLYLNYDDGVEQTWNTDRAGFIARGDERWPEVKKQLI